MQWIMMGTLDVHMLVKKPNVTFPCNNSHCETTSTNNNKPKPSTSIVSLNKSKNTRKADCKTVNNDRTKRKVDTYVLPLKIMKSTQTPVVHSTSHN